VLSVPDPLQSLGVEADVTHKTDKKLHEDVLISVVLARLDIDGYRVQYQRLPPAFCGSKGRLDEWVYDMERRGGHPSVPIDITPLVGIDQKHAVLLSSRPDSAVRYQAVWVQAEWDDYRKAMMAFMATQGLSGNGIKTVDADHVINRARVEGHKDAWLLLMPVPLDVNRSYGSAVEKKLDPIPSDPDGIALIEPVTLLKAFSDSAIRSVADLDDKLRELFGKMESDPSTEPQIRAARSAYCTLRGWPA